MLKSASMLRKDISTWFAPMQHRHYATIATIIRMNFHGDDSIRREVANTFARELRGTNPNFDRERFLRACSPE